MVVSSLFIALYRLESQRHVNVMYYYIYFQNKPSKIQNTFYLFSLSCFCSLAAMVESSWVCCPSNPHWNTVRSSSGLVPDPYSESPHVTLLLNISALALIYASPIEVAR